MDVSACFELGYVQGSHGLAGEVYIFLDVDEPELYGNLESVFVQENNALVPFFMDFFSFQKGDTALVKFEDVDSRDQADALQGKKLYLPLNRLPELKEHQFYYHEVVGYALYDGDEILGTIDAVYETGRQDLFSVSVEGKEVLVPVQDDLIKKVDKPGKAIHCVLPEGLVDIYLSDEKEEQDED